MLPRLGSIFRPGAERKKIPFHSQPIDTGGQYPARAAVGEPDFGPLLALLKE